MRVRAKPISIQIVAALIILALRPCLIVASVSRDHARTNNPAVQYIGDDSTAGLAHGRRVRVMGPAAATSNTAVLAALLIKLPEFFAAGINVVPCVLDSAVVEIVGSRAPPF